ncbi:probable calcium-binding protein CML46 [Lotus japonicus]|uniref:probable calcium-binding protein CML46 n=1 Tax=Lotus japonicus TaxID=34305 RepID=UPI002588D2AF|nr:probable calcium-binding protein CML46 [Lotus japonicus]
MALHHFDYLIAKEQTSQSDTSSSNSPLFGLIDLFLYCTIFNKILKFFSNFWCSNSEVRGEEKVSDYEFNHQENESKSEGIQRDEVKKVMAELGFFCSKESEELEEKYGSKELSELFEDQEPSLEEVKQAFDVFDENRDGFIDARELHRVLCVLGLKEEAGIEKCKIMIRNFDKNQDGRIDFIEFVKIMENRFC